MRFLRWLTIVLGVLASTTVPTTHGRQLGHHAGNVTGFQLLQQQGVDVHARQLAWKSDVHDSWAKKCTELCESMGKQCVNPDDGAKTKKETKKETKKPKSDTGQWKNGRMTYFWGSEPDLGYGTGTVGACDNKLRPFKSVAVPEKLWPKLKGRSVQIKGVCTACVVDDMCRGPECKDLDVYVGDTNDKGYDGIKKVQYKFGKQVKNHPCLK